jgi:hypothetical protein
MAVLRFPLVPAWVVASAVGGLVFGAVFASRALFTALLLGVCLGLPQWLVLRSYLPHASRWLIVSAGAMLLAWLCGLLATLTLGLSLEALGGVLGLPDNLRLALMFVPSAALAGGLVGSLQTLVLGPTPAARLPWVWSSAVAAPIFWAVLLGLHQPFGGMETTNPLVHLASGAGGGLAYGLLTGPLVQRLLARSTLLAAPG